MLSACHALAVRNPLSLTLRRRRRPCEHLRARAVRTQQKQHHIDADGDVSAPPFSVSWSHVPPSSLCTFDQGRSPHPHAGTYIPATFPRLWIYKQSRSEYHPVDSSALSSRMRSTTALAGAGPPVLAVPFEIVDDILGELFLIHLEPVFSPSMFTPDNWAKFPFLEQHGRRDLRNCTFVSRAWDDAARRRLFRALSFSSYETFALIVSDCPASFGVSVTICPLISPRSGQRCSGGSRRTDCRSPHALLQSLST
jgi:hypothetical protein